MWSWIRFWPLQKGINPRAWTWNQKYPSHLQIQTSLIATWYFPFNIGYVLFPIKICFQLVVFIFLTVFFSLILLFVILGQYMCAIMATPCIALHIICHETPEPCKCCALIFLPFLTVFLMVLFTFLMLMYPIFRNYYHHGIYDHLEKTILGGVKCYLGTMKGLISMWFISFYFFNNLHIDQMKSSKPFKPRLKSMARKTFLALMLISPSPFPPSFNISLNSSNSGTNPDAVSEIFIYFSMFNLYFP